MSIVVERSCINKSWNTFDFIALWIGACFCIPSFLLIGALKSAGFSDLNVMLIVFIGCLLIGFLCALLGKKGYKNNMGFTDIVSAIFSRSFSKIIITIRGIVCAGWFGINIIILSQTVLGVINKYILFNIYYDIVIMTFTFFVFSLLNILLAENLNIIKKFERFSSVLFLAVILYILFIDPGVNRITLRSETKQSWILSIDSILLVFYYWSGLVSNITDYTRNAKNLKHCIWGNFFGIIIGMMFVCGLALLSLNKSEIVFGIPILNPVDFFIKLHNNMAAEFIAVLLLFIFMTTTNIAANCYPAINCFKYSLSFDFKKSGFLLVVLSTLFCPWFIISDFRIYAYYWINLYSLLIIPLIGMMIIVNVPRLADNIFFKKNLFIYVTCCVSGLVLFFTLPFLSNYVNVISLVMSISLSALLSRQSLRIS